MSKTPKQNRLAERMNLTIMERVQSMLAHAKLSKKFWVEVLMTAIYVINRSPSVPLDRDIPQGYGLSKMCRTGMSCLCACSKGLEGGIGPKDSTMHIPGIW